MAGVIARMQQRGLSAAWNKWSEVVREALAAQMMMRIGILRMLNAKLAAALCTWRDAVSALLAQQQMLTSALMRLQQRGLAAAWNKWCEVADEKGSEDSRLAGSALFWQMTVLENALQTWKDSHKRRKAFLLREPQILLAAQRAWQHGSLESYFGSWQHGAWEKRHACIFTSKTDLHSRIEDLQRENELLKAEALSASKLRLQSRALVSLAMASAQCSSFPLQCIDRWQRAVFRAFIEDKRTCGF